MGCVEKVNVENINNSILDQSVLLCFASFEARCKTLSQYCDITKIRKTYIFRNSCTSSLSSAINNNYDYLKSKYTNNVEKQIKLSSSVSINDALYQTVKEIIDEEFKNLIIDITTFTHEVLLILIRILFSYRDSFSSIKLIYNSADSYSAWLSKGCKEVRNVIGYPGIFNPAKNYRLIILTGYELERATKLVELMEPDSLSLGHSVDAVSDKNLKVSNTFKKKFENWIYSTNSIDCTTFDFSCYDLAATINTLETIVNEKTKSENLIIVPLNTKLSTVSVALVALAHKNIQVVYPIPETYNSDYSKPGDYFAIIELKNIPYFNKI